jgi:hypothetical protein
LLSFFFFFTFSRSLLFFSPLSFLFSAYISSLLCSAPEKDGILWSIKQFPGGREFLMRAHFGLPSIQSGKEAEKRRKREEDRRRKKKSVSLSLLLSLVLSFLLFFFLTVHFPFCLSIVSLLFQRSRSTIALLSQ